MLIERFSLGRTAEALRAIIIHWPNYPCKHYWWGHPLLPEILGQCDRVGAKSLIINLFSLVALNKFHSVKTVSDRLVRHSLA